MDKRCDYNIKRQKERKEKEKSKEDFEDRTHYQEG